MNAYYVRSIIALSLILSASTYLEFSKYAPGHDVLAQSYQTVENPEENQNTLELVTESTTPEGTEVMMATHGTDTIPVEEKLDYADTKTIYDYRFQISNCSAITGLPSFGSLNVKQGANVVLENHDATSHVLAIGTDSYTVAGGDYLVTAAANVDKPTGYLVTCDGKGAGRLYVYP